MIAFTNLGALFNLISPIISNETQAIARAEVNKTSLERIFYSHVILPKTCCFNHYWTTGLSVILIFDTSWIIEIIILQLAGIFKSGFGHKERSRLMPVELSYFLQRAISSDLSKVFMFPEICSMSYKLQTFSIPKLKKTMKIKGMICV